MVNALHILQRLENAVFYVDGDDCEGGLLKREVQQYIEELHQKIDRAQSQAERAQDMCDRLLTKIEKAQGVR